MWVCLRLTSMCSASQPSSLAIRDAIRRAKHFFPSREFPPYPLPNDTMLLWSGMWAISVRSGLQGQLFTSGSEREVGGEKEFLFNFSLLLLFIYLIFYCIVLLMLWQCKDLFHHANKGIWILNLILKSERKKKSEKEKEWKKKWQRKRKKEWTSKRKKEWKKDPCSVSWFTAGCASVTDPLRAPRREGLCHERVLWDSIYFWMNKIALWS